MAVNCCPRPTAKDAFWGLTATETSVTTVKATPLLAMPFTLTVSGPLVAEEGTDAVILAALQLVTPATVPLKETELEP